MDRSSMAFAGSVNPRPPPPESQKGGAQNREASWLERSFSRFRTLELGSRVEGRGSRAEGSIAISIPRDIGMDPWPFPRWHFCDVGLWAVGSGLLGSND